MKTQNKKKNVSDSIKKNSMAPGGKSPKPKKINADPKEFEEERSTNIRMKPQPLKDSSRKKK